MSGVEKKSASSVAPSAKNSKVVNPKAAETKTSGTTFKTKDIGKWKSKQENPFAAQNRQAAAKEQQKARERQKIAPLWIALGSIIVTGLAIFGLAALIITLTRPPEDTPPINGESAQDVISYRDILQNFYNQSDGTTEEKRAQVSQLVENTLNTNDGKRYADQVKLAEAIFYSNNNLPDEAIKVAEGLDPNQFNLEQKLDYYNVLYYSYALKGNYEKAQEYTKIVYQLSGDLYGWEE